MLTIYLRDALIQQGLKQFFVDILVVLTGQLSCNEGKWSLTKKISSYFWLPHLSQIGFFNRHVIRTMKVKKVKKIVVIGGGYAGINLIEALKKEFHEELKRSKCISISLLNMQQFSECLLLCSNHPDR